MDFHRFTWVRLLQIYCRHCPRDAQPIPSATERQQLADMSVDGHFWFGDQEIIGTQFPLPGTALGL